MRYPCGSNCLAQILKVGAIPCGSWLAGDEARTDNRKLFFTTHHRHRHRHRLPPRPHRPHLPRAMRYPCGSNCLAQILKVDAIPCGSWLAGDEARTDSRNYFSPHITGIGSAANANGSRRPKYKAVSKPTVPMTRQKPTQTHGLHGISAISASGVVLAQSA